MANFSNFPPRVLKNQVVATILPQCSTILDTEVPIAAVLGLTTDETPPLQFKAPYLEEVDETTYKYSFYDLYHSNLEDEEINAVRAMLSKYDSMWDGTLG